jgi:hypothetical protein
LRIVHEVNHLIQEYVEVCVTLEECCFNGEYKRGNEIGKKLVTIYKQLELDKQLAAEMLQIIFTNKNVNVRIYASAHALGRSLNIPQAIATLEEIAQHSTILGLNAKTTLREYHRLGRLQFY